MKKKRNVKETEFERLKRWSSMSQDELAKELYSGIDLIDEKKLNAYIKRHKKEINNSFNRIDINKIIKRVQQSRATGKK